MLKINYRIYKIPKYGNRLDENEDAYAVFQPHKIGLMYQEYRFAIADGATQASFSSFWARLLVQFARKYVPSVKRLWDITGKAQTIWADKIARINLPWFAEEKVRKGAYSTLLWLSIKIPFEPAYPNGTWKAIAIGDSNLVIVRNAQLNLTFPIKSSQDFGNTPVLLSSVQSYNSQINDYIRSAKGSFLPGDQFLLATDALSQYILTQFENGENPCIDLAQFSEESDPNLAFENWVQRLRTDGKMRNDDTTFMVIRFEDQKLLL